MTLTELRYIIAVAEHRHFGRAAEACFVSQPTLSIAIRKLEDELGVVLFERGGGEISLTAIGERIVEQAQRVMDEVATIKTMASESRDPLKGAIRLGVIYSIGPYLLPHLIPALHKRAPEMPLILQENYTANLEAMLRRGELDVIIIASEIAGAGLQIQPVYDEPFVVALPKGHPWERKKAVRADDLAGEDMLLLGNGHCFRDQVLKLCPALNRTSFASESLQKTLVSTSLETIRHMVASGAGITVLPVTSVGSDGESESLLSIVPFAKPVPDRRVAIVWRASFTRPEAVEMVRQAILAAKLPGVTKLEPHSAPRTLAR